MSDRVSRRVAAVPPSGIRKFFDIAATMKDVISLGIGEPDFVTPDVIREAGIASLNRGETRYTSNSGILELRQAVVAKWAERYGVAYHPDDECLITIGGSEALYLALTAILEPGDEVIIPEPCFVSYEAEVVFAGGTPVPIATLVENTFQVTGAEIEAAVTPRTKAILINYPNNPTGAVLDRERMLEIAAVAARHDLLVISDEIYDRLFYSGGQHITFSGLPEMRDRTIIIGGFSKDYAMTGWRLGFALGPADILGAMRKIHQYTIMSAATTAQVAAITALTDPRAEDAVLAMVESYDVRRKLLVQGSEQHRPADVRAARRVLRLSRHPGQRHDLRRVCDDGCSTKSMWPASPAPRSGWAARVMCACAMPLRSPRSRKRWNGCSGLCEGTDDRR